MQIYELWKKENEAKIKQIEKMKDDDTFDIELTAQPDPYAPHPDFVLCSEKNRIGAREYDEIRKQLSQELSNKSGDAEGRDCHPLLRGLQRGMAIYVDDGSLAAYNRVVQGLAQRGMLAVVFSDSSLAYGVNMPFRTCCFCGDTPGLLDALMAQQMAGRAGRRGLDREGNLVYASMSWEKVKELMRGTLPHVVGRDPRYPTMCLQALLAPNYQDGSPTVATEKMALQGSRPLSSWNESPSFDELGAEKYLEACDAQGQQCLKEGVSYFSQSQDWMHGIGLLDSDGELLKGKRAQALLVWELRQFLPESVALVRLLDPLYEQFCSHKNDREYANNEGVQIEFMSVICRVCFRQQCPPEMVAMGELAYFANRKELWDNWEKLIDETQSCMKDSGLDWPVESYIPIVPDGRLDASVFNTISSGSVDASKFETLYFHGLKKRILMVGQVLRIMHNMLMTDSEGDPHVKQTMEILLRKCFLRIRYVVRDMEI